MLVPLIKKSWVFEKAEKVKDLVFAKLDEILGKLAAQDRVLESLAANDTSALQTLVYLVERAQEGQRSLAELSAGFAALGGSMSAKAAALEGSVSTKVAALEGELSSKVAAIEGNISAKVAAIESHISAKVAALEGNISTKVAAIEGELSSKVAAIEQSTREIHRALLPGGGPAVGVSSTVPTRRRGLLEPETALLVHLAPHLPGRRALDIGANLGDVSAALLEGGFEVHAFEPNPPTLQRLTRRLGGRDGFFAYGLAVGSADGAMALHLAQDTSPERWFEEESLYSSLVQHGLPPQLRFTDSVTVPVRSLASLHAAGLVPPEVALVKIDTEGWDLEVIRGMGEHRYPVVMAEFWDEAMAFSGAGAQNLLPHLALEMRRRGSPWFIVLYRLFPGDERVRWYCNLPESPETSWGNVLFFRDQALFEEARRWCAATLHRADFSKRIVPAEARDAAALGIAPSP